MPKRHARATTPNQDCPSLTERKNCSIRTVPPSVEWRIVLPSAVAEGRSVLASFRGGKQERKEDKGYHPIIAPRGAVNLPAGNNWIAPSAPVPSAQMAMPMGECLDLFLAMDDRLKLPGKKNALNGFRALL